MVLRTTEWPPEQDSTNPHPLLLRTRSSLAPGTRSITLAMALQLQLHPNVAPLFGQAQVAARGPNPQLMCDQGHTLLGYNANWFNTQNNFGPGGEVGIDEGDIAAFLANAVRPGDNAVRA